MNANLTGPRSVSVLDSSGPETLYITRTEVLEGGADIPVCSRSKTQGLAIQKPCTPRLAALYPIGIRKAFPTGSPEQGRQECPPHLQIRILNGLQANRTHLSLPKGCRSTFPETRCQCAVVELVETPALRFRSSISRRAAQASDVVRFSSGSIEHVQFFNCWIIFLTLLSGSVTSNGKQVNDSSSSNSYCSGS